MRKPKKEVDKEASAKLDEDALRKELGKNLAAAKRNECSIELAMKDISSSGKDIKNMIRWEQIAMEMVKSC